MIKITNDDNHKDIRLNKYEYLIVEIPFNPYENDKKPEINFNEVQNATVIKEIFIPDNPLILGSPGVLLYFMMSSEIGESLVEFSYEIHNIKHLFSFRLIVS